MAEPLDYYEVLGVPRTVTPDELQRAYRKLARTYHPDVNKDPEAESRFKEISEAYDVLSDPKTRTRYDTFGPDFRRVPEGVDADEWARASAAANEPGRRGGRPGGGGPGGRTTWTSSGFGGDDPDIDFDDLFGGMFGGRQRGRGPIIGADQEAELALTVDEAYRGGRRSMTFSGPDGGRTFDVNVPPGVTTGQRIRLAGQGGQGMSGGAPGDLFLVVRLTPHPRYRVDGRDLSINLPLTAWEAALGATVAVETPGGEAKVKVPAGTSSGTRLRLKGRGMPATRGKPGDLYAEVRIMMPKTLNDEERRLFEELAATSAFDPRSSS